MRFVAFKLILAFAAMLTVGCAQQAPQKAPASKESGESSDAKGSAGEEAAAGLTTFCEKADSLSLIQKELKEDFTEFCKSKGEFLSSINKRSVSSQSKISVNEVVAEDKDKVSTIALGSAFAIGSSAKDYFNNVAKLYTEDDSSDTRTRKGIKKVTASDKGFVRGWTYVEKVKSSAATLEYEMTHHQYEVADGVYVLAEASGDIMDSRTKKRSLLSVIVDDGKNKGVVVSFLWIETKNSGAHSLVKSLTKKSFQEGIYNALQTADAGATSTDDGKDDDDKKDDDDGDTSGSSTSRSSGSGDDDASSDDE